DVAFGEAAAVATFDAGAAEVDAEATVGACDRLLERSARDERPRTVQHVVDLAHLRLVNDGALLGDRFRPEHAINSDTISAGVDDANGRVADLVWRQAFQKRLDLGRGQIGRRR